MAPTAKMRRIACVCIPHFAASVERLRSKTDDRPLLVADGKRVLSACARAAESGVRDGDRLEQALTRCPEAVVVPADRARYEELWECVLEGLGRISPTSENSGWGQAFLEAGGMGTLYGGEQAWCRAIQAGVWESAALRARVGVAGGKFAANMAAKRCPADAGFLAVVGTDREYLSPLPAGELPLSDEALRRMGLLGIRTIGQFARIPAPSVAEQFGPESLQAHAWARGKDDRPVLGQRRATLEVSLDFDAPETQREPLLEATLALSRKTVAELSGTGLAVRRIALLARMEGRASWERSAWVGESVGPVKLRAVFEGLLSDLHGDGLGVIGIQAAFTGIEPAVGKQLDLFAHAERQTRLEETLHRLVKKHTPGCVVRARVASPQAILLRNRYALEDVE